MTLEEKLKELGYENNNPYFPERFRKNHQDLMCQAIIELELDEDYKQASGPIYIAYVDHCLIIHEQRVINEIQKAFNRLQEDLKLLEQSGVLENDK